MIEDRPSIQISFAAAAAIAGVLPSGSGFELEDVYEIVQSLVIKDAGIASVSYFEKLERRHIATRAKKVIIDHAEARYWFQVCFKKRGNFLTAFALTYADELAAHPLD